MNTTPELGETIQIGSNSYAYWIKETPECEILILPFMYTHAIATFPRGHEFPNWYESRWCYHTLEEAARAAIEWDGAPGTEPGGDWIRRVGALPSSASKPKLHDAT